MSTIEVRTQQVPISIKVQSSQPVVLRPVPRTGNAVSLGFSPGPVGPRGPDPWLDPVQDISGQGDITIDYAAGKHVRLHMTGDISSLHVTNWPAVNRIARLTLDLLNSGDFTILAWPAGTLWQSGNPASITRGAGARDRIIFTTTDGGAVIFGDPVGFDYR